MTSEDSKPSEDHHQRPRNHLAASLRGFGPAGIITIILILITGNVFIGTRLSNRGTSGFAVD